MYVPEGPLTAAERTRRKGKARDDGTGKGDEDGKAEVEGEGKVIISRTGAIYHDRCLPSDFYPHAREVH